jgi:hypothetical protein
MAEAAALPLALPGRAVRGFLARQLSTSASCAAIWRRSSLMRASQARTCSAASQSSTSEAAAISSSQVDSGRNTAVKEAKRRRGGAALT